jgi:hypothetical protein
MICSNKLVIFIFLSFQCLKLRYGLCHFFGVKSSYLESKVKFKNEDIFIFSYIIRNILTSIRHCLAYFIQSYGWDRHWNSRVVFRSITFSILPWLSLHYKQGISTTKMNCWIVIKKTAFYLSGPLIINSWAPGP